MMIAEEIQAHPEKDNVLAHFNKQDTLYFKFLRIVS